VLSILEHETSEGENEARIGRQALELDPSMNHSGYALHPCWTWCHQLVLSAHVSASAVSANKGDAIGLPLSRAVRRNEGSEESGKEVVSALTMARCTARTSLEADDAE